MMIDVIVGLLTTLTWLYLTGPAVVGVFRDYGWKYGLFILAIMIVLPLVVVFWLFPLVRGLF